MRELRYLLRKEFRQIFRNTMILRMIIAVPIIQLLILPLAADYEIKNINIVVVDFDHSTVSRALTNAIISSGYFKLRSYGTDYPSAFRDVERDKADILLAVPSGFERGLVRGGEQQVQVEVNAINGTKANVGGFYLLNILSQFNRSLASGTVTAPVFHPQPTIDVAPIIWYNPLMRYRFFMVPGILVILVTLVGVILCSLNIVSEKERGTIEQINVTPIRKYQFIIGKLIPFWVIGVVMFSIGLLGVARLVYGIVPVGHLSVVYAFLSIYLVAVLGIGLTISSYSATQQQAMSLAFFFMMIFLLMSGLFTPIESMPEWAQWITRINPVTYFIEAIRLVVLKGSGFYELRKDFAVISVMAVFFNLWAVMNYKKTS